MQKNETKTASRVYYTTENDGIWHANFQPLNPKTGIPWQRSHEIQIGCDCYRLFNWNTKAQTPIIIGKFPSFDVWTKVDGGMTGGEIGYSSEALALAAINTEKGKSGK